MFPDMHLPCLELHLSAGINDLSIAHIHEVVVSLPTFLVEDFPSEILLFFQYLSPYNCNFL